VPGVQILGANDLGAFAAAVPGWGAGRESFAAAAVTA
jgi:hypothetical protein